VVIAAPLVVDHAAARCPAADARAAREFRAQTAFPRPDVTLPTGDPALSRTAVQKWLDSYEANERRKNATGQRVLREYERCRTGPAPVG